MPSSIVAGACVDGAPHATTATIASEARNTPDGTTMRRVWMVYGSEHMSRQAPIAFIMAAGLGTRMKSDTAKVLHRIAGRPMLHWVVRAARAAGVERVVAILGHQHEAVKASLDAAFGAGAVDIALQLEQRGTGHAV